MVGILVWTSVAVMYLHMRKLLRTRTISTGKSKKGGITATDKEKSLMNILKYLPAVLLLSVLANSGCSGVQYSRHNYYQNTHKQQKYKHYDINDVFQPVIDVLDQKTRSMQERSMQYRRASEDIRRTNNMNCLGKPFCTML